MRAAVYKGGKQFAIEEMPDPTPGPGEVVVDVNYCAICGTDVHHFMYDIAPVGEVMGHEYLRRGERSRRRCHSLEGG